MREITKKTINFIIYNVLKIKHCTNSYHQIKIFINTFNFMYCIKIIL